MVSAAPWPVRVRTIGQVSGGTIAWRFRGQCMLTAIAKVTLSLVPGGAMTVAPPTELKWGDSHADGDVRRSLLASSDVAPHRPSTDVLLTGHAALRPGATPLRLAISRGQNVVLDRTIHLVDRGSVVVGDKAGARSPVLVPLVYEEAVGGPGRDDNPAGNAAPRLVDPKSPNHPACFAPIPQSWPARNRLLGGLNRRAIDGSHLDLPPEFDWSFYQAAPAEQRIAYLQGDEWLLLSGLHPTIAVLKSQLPQIGAVAEVSGAPGGSKVYVDLTFDTLHVDVDRQTCSVVFRGNVRAPEGVPFPALEVAVRAETGRVSGVFAAQMPAPASVAGSVGLRTSPIDDVLDRTHTLEARLVDISPDGGPWPFAIAAPGGSASFGRELDRAATPTGRDIPGAPWAGLPAAPAPAITDGLEATFALDLPAAARAVIQALAPLPHPAPEPPALVQAAPVSPPMAFSPPAAVSLASVASWPAPRATPPSEAELDSTAVPLPIPAPAPPSAPASTKRQASEWTTASPDDKPPPAPPPAPAAPRRESAAAAAVNRVVYGRFAPPKR